MQWLRTLLSDRFCRSSWGLSWGCHQGISQGCSHLKAQLGKGLLSSSLLRLLARLSSSRAVGLRASLSYLPCESLRRAAHDVAKWERRIRERKWARYRSPSFIAKSQCAILSSLPILFLRSKSVCPAPFKWRELHKGVEKGSRHRWEPLRDCLPGGPALIFSYLPLSFFTSELFLSWEGSEEKVWWCVDFQALLTPHTPEMEEWASPWP